jgi:DNA-binding MarR family transcriptional regulator
VSASSAPPPPRLIARLEEAASSSAAPPPDDGRSMLVAVTPPGRALLRKVRTRRDAFLAERLAGLSDPDRATLERATEVLERPLEVDPR